jgi:hypothetical protein
MSISANGSSFTGPVTVLRNGAVRECSIVTLGADPNTSVQVFGAPNSRDFQIRELRAAIGELISIHERKMLQNLSEAQFTAVSTCMRELAARRSSMLARARQLASIGAIYDRRRGVVTNRDAETKERTTTQTSAPLKTTHAFSLSPSRIYAKRLVGMG